MNEETLGLPEQYDQTTAQPVTEQPVQEQKAAEAAVAASDKEQNMRYLRERAEAAERRSQELERMMQMNMNQNAPTTKLQIEEEEFDLSDDTYIEGKHLKKYVNNLKKELKETKKRQEDFMRQATVSNAEIRLKSQFTDFDAVVSKENLEKLSIQKPSLFRSIMSNPDIYDQGFTAYEMIKNSGISNNVYESQDRKIEENKSKPRSSTNAGPQTSDTPLARVGDYDRRILTDERKLQLLRQVEEAKRYRS